MSPAAALPDSAEPPPEADDAYYTAILKRMLDAGDKIVADLAAEPSPAGPKAEPFERLTRGVRRTVILLRHITENPLKSPRAAAEQAEAAITIGRRRIARDVDNAIVRAAGNGPRAESLRLELRERLDDPALDLDIVHRPLDVVITEIRRDSGLDNTQGVTPWPRRTPEQVRALNAFAAAGGPRLQASPEPHLYRDHDDIDDEPATLLTTILKHRNIRDG